MKLAELGSFQKPDLVLTQKLFLFLNVIINGGAPTRL